jgi:parvulin-like peptidyl-prolyl isomerase
MRSAWLVLLGIGILGWGACREGEADPVILALGDGQVRRSDFERHLATLTAQGLDASAPDVRRSVLDSFLEERVLVLEARARGTLRPGASPEDEQVAAQEILAEAAQSSVDVPDQEIAAYYEAHRSELSQPETVVLRQILVPTENEARDVRRRLAREPKSFEVLAQTRSRAPEASAGGLMGRFSRGELPSDLEEVAFSVPIGGFSDPLKTPLGYHVLKVDAREPARERSLEECAGEIRHLLAQRSSAEATREAVRKLLLRAKVNYEAARSPRSR